MERLFVLTKREYFADFFITPPITVALAIISFSGSPLVWLAMFVVGLLAWTFYEYVVHRLSHHLWILRDIHHLHHDDQKAYIAVHPIATVALYVAFWLVFGPHSTALAVGFSVGYVIYAAAHTLFHYARITPASPLYRLKRHHALHHRFDNVNFGVITTLWDRAFGTYRA